MGLKHGFYCDLNGIETCADHFPNGKPLVFHKSGKTSTVDIVVIQKKKETYIPVEIVITQFSAAVWLCHIERIITKICGSYTT